MDVIPSESREWSGLGSRDMDGKAERLSERGRRANQIFEFLTKAHLALCSCSSRRAVKGRVFCNFLLRSTVV
jgi:hypothetical protein